MCNLPWTPHSNLEKDNSLNHSCVSPQRCAVWSILTKKHQSSIESGQVWTEGKTVKAEMIRSSETSGM